MGDSMGLIKYSINLISILFGLPIYEFYRCPIMMSKLVICKRYNSWQLFYPQKWSKFSEPISFTLKLNHTVQAWLFVSLRFSLIRAITFIFKNIFSHQQKQSWKTYFMQIMFFKKINKAQIIFQGPLYFRVNLIIPIIPVLIDPWIIQ